MGANPSLPSEVPSTTPDKQLGGIQILRAIAALAVVAHHTIEESLPILAPQGISADGLMHAFVLWGASGVDLFFVISGFIMIHTNWNQFGVKDSSSRFLWRRVARIAPMYWLFGIVVLVAKFGGFYQSLNITPGLLISSLLLLPAPQHLIAVAWTLVLEMYFYYLFAAWLHCKCRNYAIVGVCSSIILVLLLSIITLPAGAFHRYMCDPIVLEFCFGLGVGLAFRMGYQLPIPRTMLLIAAALSICGAIFLPSNGTSTLANSSRFWAWGIPATIIVFAALRFPKPTAIISNILIQIGGASYVLYLSHSIVMTAYARLLKNKSLAQAIPAPLWVLLTVTFCVVLAWLIHRYIEEKLTDRIQMYGAKLTHA